MDDKTIHIFMDLLNIENYTIRDGKVEAEGNVVIDHRFKHIPVPFRSVSGDFYCSSRNVRSLQNSPTEVGGSFHCNSSNITSLKHSPTEVQDFFICRGCNITSLEGSPIYVGKGFVCDDTLITSLKGSPRYVGGDFSCSSTNITSLEGAPDEVEGNFSCYCLFDKEPDHSHIKIGGNILWDEDIPNSKRLHSERRRGIFNSERRRELIAEVSAKGEKLDW